MPFHTPEEQARNPQGQGQQQPQDDLGQSLTQPQPTGASPSFRNSVDGFFQDPVNRAGLLSFGLNMLSGGFGTPLQQFAHAAGQGVESAAGAQAFQTKQDRLDENQDFRERQLGQRATLARESQTGATNRANIVAKARLKAAGIGSSSLANKLLSGFTATRLAALKRMSDVLDPNHDKTSEEQGAIATREAEEGMQQAIDFARRQTGQNITSPFPGGQSRPNPPSGAPPAQPPQAAPAPETGRPNSGGQRTPLSSLSGSPNFQRALERDQTPEGKLFLWNNGIVPSPPFTPPQSDASILSGGQQQGTGNPLDALRR